MAVDKEWPELYFPPINLYNFPVQDVFRQAQMIGNVDMKQEHVQKLLYGEQK